MIRLKTHRFNDLDRPMLLRLQGLTNDTSRGDFRDGGKEGSGSVFRRRLDERLMGEVFPDECWALIVYRWLEPAAWALVTRHQHGPDGEPLSFPTASVGFYVHPDHRRSGHGTRLVQEACELSRKNGIQRLLVNPWNAVSLSFFQSNGFEVLDEYVSGWARGIAVKDLAA